MKFLSEAHAKSLMPTASIISLLRHNMGGMEKARSHKVLHASDVTRENFCPRRFALLLAHDKKMPDSYVPTALRATFDLGNAVADIVREQWLGQAAVGNWHCARCGTTKTMTTKPDEKEGCFPSPGKHIWKYREMNFISGKYQISGSIDVLIRLGAAKLFVTELKIMAPSQFDELLAPLSEHRIRTNLYMRLIDESASPWRNMINLQEAKVLYVSRGYGKKHDQHNEILPFKEYTVERNDADLEPLMEQAFQLKLWADDPTGGALPDRICASYMDKCAKGCPVAKECFS